MTIMTRQRALTVLTDELYIGDVIYFKSPCFRALLLEDRAVKILEKGLWI